MRVAMLRLSKLNVFVEPDGQDGCKFVLRVIKGQREREREGRKSGKTKLKRKSRRKEVRQVASKGGRSIILLLRQKPVLDGCGYIAHRETDGRRKS